MTTRRWRTYAFAAFGTIATSLALAGPAGAVYPSSLGPASSLGQTIVNPDGSIIGVGTTGELGPSPGNPRAAKAPFLVKLRADGSIDPGFASGGVKVLSGYESVTGPIELLPAGEGSSVLAIGRYLFKFTPDGKPDWSFGDGGEAGPFEYGGLEITSAAIQDDGKVVVAAGNYQQRVYVARFTAAGEPDESFGLGGVIHLTDADPPAITSASAIGFDGNQRILVGGMGPAGPVAVRLLPDGQLDSSFGPDGDGYSGSVTSPDAPRFSSVAEIAVDPDGTFRLYGVRSELYAWANLGISFDADGLAQGDSRYMGGFGSGVFAETPGGVATTVAPGRGGPLNFNVMKTDRGGNASNGFSMYEPRLAPGDSLTKAITYSPGDDALIATGSTEAWTCTPGCSRKSFMVAAKIDADTGAPIEGFGENGVTLLPREGCAYGEVAYDSPSAWRHCRVLPPKLPARFVFHHAATRQPALFGAVRLAGIQPVPELMERHLTITLPQKLRLRPGARSKLFAHVGETGTATVTKSLTGRNIRVDIIPRRENFDEEYGPLAPPNKSLLVTVGLKRGAITKIRRPFRRMPLKIGIDATYTPSSEPYNLKGPAINWWEPNRTVTADRVRPLPRRTRR